MPGCTTSYTPLPALPAGRLFHRRPAGAQQRHSARRPLWRPAARPEPVDPVLDGPCPVPWEQQPMQEYRLLKEAWLFDWADLPPPQFALRLGGVWAAFLVALGLPVSVLTFDLSRQPLECLVAASTGSLFLVGVLVLRLYLGYSHVGSRLLSHKIIYEETGWYDGQVWVKTPQMLFRDRLLGIQSVRPALQRLKYALYSLGGGLVLSITFLAFSPPSDATNLQLNAAPPARAAAAARDYWDAVREYEPWALEEAEDSAEAVAGHLMGSGSMVSY